MEAVFGWVRNITYYYIFITVINQLLPNKKYEKYIRLFSGFLLILIVINPVAKGLRIEEQLKYYFEAYTFKNDAGDFEKELLGIENKRRNDMLRQYEQAIAMDIEQMAEDGGFYPHSTLVNIEKDQNHPKFGSVTSVRMRVASEPPKAGEVDPVDPISVVIGEREYQEEQTVLNVLRRKIESYYGLEAGDVEVQLEYE